MKFFVHIALIVTSLFSMTTMQATGSIPLQYATFASAIAGAKVSSEATQSLLKQYQKQYPYLAALLCASSIGLIASDFSYSFFSKAWVNSLIEAFIKGLYLGTFVTSGLEVADQLHEHQKKRA